MAAPVGAVVGISPYDLADSHDWPDPEPGDWLVTWSAQTERWGTAYRIVGARQVRSAANPRRFSLRCEVVGPASTADIRDDDQVYPLVWYRRDRKRPR